MYKLLFSVNADLQTIEPIDHTFYFFSQKI